MLACFAIAACSAVAHHCFYQSLSGHRVDEQKYDQNENIYIGTALTTLTKLALSAAVTLAYSQILWRRLLGNKLRISHIDSISTLVTTPSNLDDWRILRDFPLLVVLAVVAWCLSIITVFPPGTLSVVSALTNSTSSVPVPSMDFSLALVSETDGRAISHTGVFGPDDTTNYTFPALPKGSAGALGTVTAFTGEIPRIRTAETNSSYSTSFFGPVLSCSTKQVKTNHIYCSGRGEMSFVSFLSYPQDRGSSFHDFFGLNASLPIDTSGNSSSVISCSSIASFRASTFGVYPPELFVVAKTSVVDSAPDGDIPRQEWEATSCELRNATYEVKVESRASNQVITVRTSDESPLGLTTDYIPNLDSSPDLNEPAANRIFDYFAAMAMMAQTVVGTIDSSIDGASESSVGGGTVDTTPAPFPGIFSTRLSSSPEIQAFAKWSGSLRVGESTSASASDGPPLAQQMEELFRNMTVAMLTSPATSSNATVPILSWYSVNIYKYTAWHLWLAYGIGLLATAVILILGFIAIAANGGPYSTRFSTYLRTTLWSRIEEVLSEGSDTGADPLPRDVAREKVLLGRGSVVSKIEMMPGNRISDGSVRKQSESTDRERSAGSRRNSLEEIGLVSPER